MEARSLFYSRVVLEPDPRKNRKEGLGNSLGWKFTKRNVWIVSSHQLELLAIRGPTKISARSLYFLSPWACCS